MSNWQHPAGRSVLVQPTGISKLAVQIAHWQAAPNRKIHNPCPVSRPQDTRSENLESSRRVNSRDFVGRRYAATTADRMV